MRKIALFTLLLFLAAQGMLVFHSMENGIGDHEHGGKKCEIGLYAHKLGNTIVPDAPVLDLPAEHHQDFLENYTAIILSTGTTPFSARAPPALS